MEIPGGRGGGGTKKTPFRVEYFLELHIINCIIL